MIDKKALKGAFRDFGEYLMEWVFFIVFFAALPTLIFWGVAYHPLIAIPTLIIARLWYLYQVKKKEAQK
jgi:hypothetical protein